MGGRALRLVKSVTAAALVEEDSPETKRPSSPEPLDSANLPNNSADLPQTSSASWPTSWRTSIPEPLLTSIEDLLSMKPSMERVLQGIVDELRDRARREANRSWVSMYVLTAHFIGLL